MVAGNSTNLSVFNFTILLKSRKFDARKIYMLYSNLSLFFDGCNDRNCIFIALPLFYFISDFKQASTNTYSIAIFCLSHFLKLYFVWVCTVWNFLEYFPLYNHCYLQLQTLLTYGIKHATSFALPRKLQQKHISKKHPKLILLVWVFNYLVHQSSTEVKRWPKYRLKADVFDNHSHSYNSTCRHHVQFLSVPLKLAMYGLKYSARPTDLYSNLWS